MENIKNYCSDCGRSNSRTKYFKEFNTVLCDTCIRTWRNNPIKYIPPAGEIHTDDEGKLICHICGRSYDKLTSHIKGKHKISEHEYKERFGLNRTCRLTSEKLQETFRNNPTVDILSVRVQFKKGHTVTKGKTKRLQTIKNRTGLTYKTKDK